MLWFSCEGQMDVSEMFSDNSDLSAISERKGLTTRPDQAFRTFFQVGSVDWDDVVFPGRRIRRTQDQQNGPYNEVSQSKEGH